MQDQAESITVAALADAEEGEFRDWLAGRDDARIYASPDFIRCLQAIVGGEATYLVARRGRAIAGALPFLERTHPDYGRVVNSLPWYGSHGGSLLTSALDGAARRALLDAYAARALRDGLLSATMVLTPGETQHLAAYEAALAPRATDDRIGQVTELPPAGPGIESRLEATLLQKTRNLVRKSLRQGFRELVTDEEWAWRFLHETHVENMAAVGGRPKPWRHFEIFRERLPEKHRTLSVALLGDLPVAAMLLFPFNRTIEYITPVCKLDHRSSQPLSFLLWQALIRACEQGYRWWNWGGTGRAQKTLHHFKAGWGAVDQPYSYLICAPEAAETWLRQATPEVWTYFDFYYVYPFDRLASRERIAASMPQQN